MIPSSNAIKLMELYNKKLASRDRRDIQACKKLHAHYKYFAEGKYQVIGTTCYNGHFFVVTATFDAMLQEVFEEVVPMTAIEKVAHHYSNRNNPEPVITPEKSIAVVYVSDDEMQMSPEH